MRRGRPCFYRAEVDELYAALQEDSEAKQIFAADVLRSLVSEIIPTPEHGARQINVRGDLAGILALSFKSKKPYKGAFVDHRDRWLRGPDRTETCQFGLFVTRAIVGIGRTVHQNAEDPNQIYGGKAPPFPAEGCQLLLP